MRAMIRPIRLKRKKKDPKIGRPCSDRHNLRDPHWMEHLRMPQRFFARVSGERAGMGDETSHFPHKNLRRWELGECRIAGAQRVTVHFTKNTHQADQPGIATAGSRKREAGSGKRVELTSVEPVIAAIPLYFRRLHFSRLSSSRGAARS